MHFCEEKGKLLHVYKEKSSPGSLGQLAFAAAESQSHAALPAADSNKSITVSSVGEWRCGMWSVQNILPLSLLHPQVPLLLQHQVPSMGCSPSQNEIPTVQNSPSPCPFNGVQTVQTSGMSFFKLAGMASFLTRGSFWALLTGAYPAMTSYQNLATWNQNRCKGCIQHNEGHIQAMLIWGALCCIARQCEHTPLSEIIES